MYSPKMNIYVHDIKSTPPKQDYMHVLSLLSVATGNSKKVYVCQNMYMYIELPCILVFSLLRLNILFWPQSK